MEGRRIYVKHPSYYSNSLRHSGTKGMHWGERLYQYEDGSLTPLGRVHYGIGQARVKRAEKAAERKRRKEERAAEEKRQKEEKKAAEDRKKYQNEDGTLNFRGKVHYKTNDKYKLLTDDEIKQQTNRLQLQKNLEELKKQSSGSYRIKSKLTSTAEDLLVSGFKKAGEKIVNHYVDETLSTVLNTDKEDIARGREVAEKLANMSSKEIGAWNTRQKAEKEAYERLTGQKIPKDYKYSDLTDTDKQSVNKPNENSSKPEKQKPEANNTPSKPNGSPSKSEKPEGSASSNQKSETTNSSELKKEVSKPSENKPEEHTERVDRTVKSETEQSNPNNEKPKQSESSEERASRAYNINSTDYKSLNRKIRIRAYEKPETNTERASRAYGVNKTEKGIVRKYENKAESVNKSRIKGLRSSGMTISEIAKKLGISTSTVEKYL